MSTVVLRYGIIAGLILAVVGFGLSIIMGDMEMSTMEVVGYTAMGISLPMVYLGIRAHRMQLEGQTIKFSTAFAVGFLIALIASVFWAGGFEVFLATSDGNWFQEYQSEMIAGMQENGVPQAEIDAEIKEMESMGDLMENPVFRFLIAMMEVLVIGVVVALISAFIESRRKSA